MESTQHPMQMTMTETPTERGPSLIEASHAMWGKTGRTLVILG